MSKALTKGFSNTAMIEGGAPVFNSVYKMNFNTNYTEAEEWNSNNSNSKKLEYKNGSSPTTRASEFVHIEVGDDAGAVSYKGPTVKEMAAKRVKAGNLSTRTISIGLQGWDIVDDAENSSFKPYSVGYWTGLNLTFEKDDLVTPEVVTERLERLLSLLTSDSGMTSRIARLMNGKYQEID
jgi:hypothetical protein